MNPTAIIISDIHMPHKITYQPKCRIDSYWNAFARKIKFIKRIQKKYGSIPILDGGDLCHRSRLDPEIEAWAIKHLPHSITTVAGNHEIPSHNLNYLNKSSLSVIDAGMKSFEILYKSDTISQIDKYPTIIHIYGFSYGQKLEYRIISKTVPNVAIIHTMVYPPKQAPPMEKIQYSDGLKLLKKMKEFNLIITGHNHQSFIVEYKGRKLINPGSLMRSTADQRDYHPRIFLWDSETNEIEPVEVPIRKNAVTDEYLRQKEFEENRMDGFIESLKTSEIEIDYRKNMERFLRENPGIKTSTKEIILEVM